MGTGVCLSPFRLSKKWLRGFFDTLHKEDWDMVRKNAEMARLEKPEMWGGAGTVRMTQIVREEELMGKGRLFNHITIDPGCSIGLHTHTGEAEYFYILSGSGVASDNGQEILLEKGDMLRTGDGECHALRNDGVEPLELVAVILFS